MNRVHVMSHSVLSNKRQLAEEKKMSTVSYLQLTLTGRGCINDHANSDLASAATMNNSDFI